RPLYEGRPRQHRRAAGGPRARPQTLGCAARGHPLQAHHHRLAQPRHHARIWAQREAPRRIAETSQEFDALCELERAAAAVDLNPTAAALDQYYDAQRRLRVALAGRPAPPAQNPQALPDPRWLITDFVTLGSPLAHAEFLIAASADDLAKRKFERELPES